MVARNKPTTDTREKKEGVGSVAQNAMRSSISLSFFFYLLFPPASLFSPFFFHSPPRSVPLHSSVSICTTRFLVWLLDSGAVVFHFLLRIYPYLSSSLSLSRVAQIENREHVDRETGPLRGSIAPNIRPSSRAKLGWGKFLPSFLFDNAVHSPFFFLFLFFCCLVVFIVDTSFIV